MRGIILAAGRGKRMGNLTKNHPKAMLMLHGKPLIEWQMLALRTANITDLAIIKGYKSEVFSYNVHYFKNNDWEQTNMLSTLLCAEEWLSHDTCLISYSDIVYTPEAVEKLQQAEGDIVITFDTNWLRLWQQRFTDPLSDAEVFKYKNNKLIDIGGRTESLEDIQGQYMGLLKFTVNGWKKVKEFLQEFSKDAINKLDMTALLKLMLKNNVTVSVAAVTSPWCEVDNAEDYLLCQKIMEKELIPL